MWYTEAVGIRSMPKERSASCLTVMMITRFNAECKECPEGKGKFTAKERLYNYLTPTDIIKESFAPFAKNDCGFP